MTKKTPKQRKSSIRSPADSRLGRMNVLLEDIRQQNNAVMDALKATANLLERKMEERFSRIEMRLDVLEMVVRQNSADIRKNSEDIEALRVQLVRVNEILRTEDQENSVVALERRVRVLEDRLGVSPS